MRIVHLTPHLPPDQAANAILPSQLGLWSVEQGHRVSYVAHPPMQGGAPMPPDAGPVAWVPRRVREGLLYRLKIDALLQSRRIADVLDQVATGADLLHLHSNGLLIESGATWARQHRVPYMLTLYGTEIWHFRPRRIDYFQRAYRGAAAVTFYSRGLLDRAVELGLARDGLSVVYPAVSPSFSPKSDADRLALRAALNLRESRVIVNVKRLHELAGQTHLLDAFAAIRRHHADSRLVICGAGALRASLEAQAVALGITSHVTFTGLIANDDVAKYVACADVFALPSLLEALPTVAVAALAAGTPVVSTDHPGGVELHALFGDDVQVVARRDAAALAAVLGAHLAAPRRTRPDTANVLQSHFSPAAVARQYHTLYRGMLPS